MKVGKALVAQRVNNALHYINLYPVESPVSFVFTYPLDSDLSVGWRYLPSEQLEEC